MSSKMASLCRLSIYIVPHTYIKSTHEIIIKLKYTFSGLPFGNSKCPCVGFDNIERETTVSIDGKDLSYPADLGGSCSAWDHDIHPDTYIYIYIYIYTSIQD